MKTLKIAAAFAVLSLTGLAAAADRIDLGAAQQRAEQGLSPLGTGETVALDDSARPTSHQLGEAQQQAVTGEGYTPATGASASAPTTAAAPTFGIGEAQQLAETGEGYAAASAARPAHGGYASVRQ